jgi:hypothetical protein
LKLLGFSNNGGATILNSFTLPENQQTTTDLYATLTTEPNPNAVPLPAAFVAGAPLLGLSFSWGAMKRRRRAMRD